MAPGTGSTVGPKQKQASKEKQGDVLSAETSSPELATVELTDSDTPPPCQNKSRPAHKTPATVVEHVVQEFSTADVISNIAGVYTQAVSISEATASSVAVATGVMCASAVQAQAAMRRGSSPGYPIIDGQSWCKPSLVHSVYEA